MYLSLWKILHLRTLLHGVQQNSTSSKKSGGHHHTRNPMACTNCRARKIKCESNRQYPDRPCQRCTNRKLRCEYVAISHPPPPTPNEHHRTSSTPAASSFAARQPHTQAPSAQSISPPLRYSPISYTSASRSPRPDMDYISRTQSPYPSIVSPRFSYASRETSSPAFYDTYYSAGDYDPSTINMSATPHVSNTNAGVRSHSAVPRNANFSVPEVTQRSGQYFDQTYVDWNIPFQDSISQERSYYSGECHCIGMQCTCGRRRTSYWPAF